MTENNTMIQLYRMNYVTTNIRISEEDYLRLKAEAAKKRKSFSAVVRERIKKDQKNKRTKANVEKIMKDLEKTAQENAKYTKGFDSVKALREIRYHGKW